MKKISVIIPIYNVEKYLRQALDSVLNQTLSDIEIVCVNDKSTDSSLSILEEYTKTDNRIQITNKKTDIFSLIHGEYTAILNPQDYIDKFMYEKMYNQAKKLNSDVVICDYAEYDEKTKNITEVTAFSKAVSLLETKPFKIPAGINIDKPEIYKSLLISESYYGNKLYRTDFLKKNNIQFPSSKDFANVIFNSKCIVLADKISYINWPYYIHNTTLHTQKIKNIHRYLLKSYNENKKFFKSQNLQHEFNTNLINYITINTKNLYDTLNDNDFNILIQSFKKHLPAKVYHIVATKFDIGFAKILKRTFSYEHIQNHKVTYILGFKINIKDKNCQKLSASFINKALFAQFSNIKDTYILFDNLINQQAENIDAYLLYKMMRANNIKAYYVTLKDSNIDAIETSDKNIIRLKKPVTTHANDFLTAIYKPLLKAKTVITTCNQYSNDINEFFKCNPYFEYVYLPSTPIYLKNYLLNFKENYANKYNKFISTSETETNLLQSWDIDINNIIKCGLPRWDFLNNTEKPEEQSILVMFGKRNLTKLNFNSSYYRNKISELLNNKELINYLKEKNIKIYFAPNPDFSPNFGYDFGIDNENVIIADTKQISKYIKNCSCLITDYSSVAFDFMYQNKPVLYYLFDKNNFDEKNTEDYEKFKNTVFFNIFEDETTLLEKIKHYTECNYKISPEIISFYSEFFYPKGNYTTQLIKWLED